MAAPALIGRAREIEVLSAVVDGALGGGAGGVGGPGAALVIGEAGVGKSALVGHVAAQARAGGTTVLPGLCWADEGAPERWPWIQVLRSLRTQVGAERWESLQAASPFVQRLLGSGHGATAAADDTFLVQDAVTSTISAAAHDNPVLLVLEDLHWADPASLELAQFLVQHTALERVALVATLRDEDTAAVRDVTGRLARASTLHLTGLGVQEVGALVERVSGRAPGPELLSDICLRTGGNPFFVEQAAALWDGPAMLHTVPWGVREVIERRLAHLPSDSVRLLEVAALWGADFDRDVVLATAPPGYDTASFEPAIPGLVRPVAGPRLAFVHDLVREVLAAGVRPEDRERMHAQAVRVIHDDPILAGRILPSQLAERAHLAGSGLTDGETVPILLAAAREAAARMAAAESARHYSRALERMSPTEPQRLSITLALGAQQRAAGELAAARATFGQVVTDAQRNGDVVARAEGALGLHGVGHAMGEYSGHLLIDDVLAELREDPALARSGLAARAMAAAARARAHLIGADRDRAELLSGEAVTLAREIGDDAALGLCLVARHDTVWSPGTAPERLALAGQVVEVGRRLADPELELLGLHLRVVALLELGDPRALQEHAQGWELAQRLHAPRGRYQCALRQATIDTLQGRLTDARRAIDAAAELGARLGEPNGESVRIDQLFQLARLTGRFAELDPIIRSLRAEGDPHVLVLEVAIDLDRGDPERAVPYSLEVAELGRRWPRWGALMWLSLQADLASASGDPDACRRAQADLVPWRDLWVVLGGAVLVNGPMAYPTCRLSIQLGDWDAAVDAGAQALAAAERMSARPWVVLAELRLAEALVGRDASGDRRRASALVERARQEASAMGMDGATAQAAALSDPLATSRAPGQVPAGPASRGTADNVLHFDGGVWTVKFRGRVTLMPDAKGLHDLRVLLSRPGVDIPARDLLDPAAPEVLATTLLGADRVLDETAKANFLRRIRQLEAEAAGAQDDGDDELAQRLRAERSAIIAELARATGLGGRDRRLGDASERARKAVSARLRDVIRRLEPRDPSLAAHLRGAISTGTVCSYRPQDGSRWGT